MNPKLEEVSFKVVIVGNSGVGKTAFIDKLALKKQSTDTKPTTGVDFVS